MNILKNIKNIFHTDKKIARIITNDLNKIYGDNTPLQIALYESNTPLTDKQVNIKINGVTYPRKTDENGIAKLNINLPIKEDGYDAHISFIDPDYEYTNSYCNVNINPVLLTNDLNMVEGDGNKYQAVVQDINGHNVPGVKVIFNINGMDYERTSNMNGVASLNINLQAGDYEIMTRCVNTIKKNKIHIDKQPPKPTRMEGTDITKNYGDTTPYQCAVYDDQGRVTGTVNILLNGIKYRKTPDSEGLYKLNINLLPGTYTVKAEFEGNVKYASSSITNTIIINEPPKPQPKSYEQELLEYFESKFGEVNSIDGALSKIEDRGYGYYYDSQFSNKESINRMARYDGVNCTDSSQVFYHIGRALGYEVQFIHVQCSGGDGHVRLRLKHPVNTNGEWIYRDPAAVLADNGQGVTYNWCLSGYVIAYNPSWIFEDLYW